MKYVECPDVFEGNERSLFLAGGITGCENWQTKLVKLLEDTDLTLLNPRRKHFPTDNPNIEEEQITWEHNHLAKTNAVSFWFPKETLCPITLYELGKQSVSDKPIFIGVHPEYTRRKDVEIQTKLVRPGVKIVYSIEELAEQIKEWSMKSLNNILDK
ncbi:MAG: nucleoside 2-deoxyribosyltransferase domain-containing protein [Nanoarchaeota archaeon]|nr:nucleoside 2-deoxyribosyltransferase domain-containing protein [Nanoarchaeota archaeon]MBU1104075.1 nucleoside 2-deoxyribosyltransferase domain-containing protein [Nanoarchaeota archaeon]